MKRQIRIGTFETNSSSMHSLCIVTEEEFKDWLDGKTYFDDEKEKFITKEEAIEKLKDSEPEIETLDEEMFERLINSYQIYTIKAYKDAYADQYIYSHNYESKSGDKIVVFGHHEHSY